MAKKTGTLIKVVAFAAGIAAVGAACYVYRDKIKEFMEKNDVKGKVNNAKNFVTDKIQKTKGTNEFDESEFFDDFEEDASRGYTSISMSSEEQPTIKEKAADVIDAVADKAKVVTEKVVDKVEDVKQAVKENKKSKTRTEDASEAVEIKIEDAKQPEVKPEVKTESLKLETPAPEEYEYEGLSDVSEDEDALAEEAALEGV